MTATSPTATYMGTTLTIGLFNATNGVALTLTPVTGPGTISLASGGSLGLYSVGSTGSLASTGSVQITAFDTATRKVSGTFSFDATDLATGTVTHITNGAFSNLTF